PKDGSDELDLLYWENWKREEYRVPSIHLEEQKMETGILNSSYGIIWDTAETIVSRSFDDETIPRIYKFKRLIRCIEHNANEEDLIAKMGVLSEINNPRFHGKIFIYKNARALNYPEIFTSNLYKVKE
ncbi:45811_t:CDS:2, partial [Gigaspora margarita]